MNATITGGVTGVFVPNGNFADIENSIIWGNSGDQINALADQYMAGAGQPPVVGSGNTTPPQQAAANDGQPTTSTLIFGYPAETVLIFGGLAAVGAWFVFGRG